MNHKNSNIYIKLQRIQNRVGELKRTEKNKFQNYFFFNELQVLRLLKPLLEEYKLLVLLSDDISQPFIQEKEGKEHHVKYLKKLEIVDCEADNLKEEGRLTFTFWACGNNVDLAKAKGSAETYAIKYLLTKFFLIPVKDEGDPDYRDENKQKDYKSHNSRYTINHSKIEELYQLFVAKRGSDISKQNDFFKQIDQILEKIAKERKEKLIGKTDAGNFRSRLANLTEADYQELKEWLNNLK